MPHWLSLSRVARFRALSRLAGRSLLGLLLTGFALALCTTRPAAAAEEMSFHLVSVGNLTKCGTKCPEVIAAEGEITESTPAKFLSFVQHNLQSANLHAIVFIHSPGGKVRASMELGRIWRRLGAAAVVARVFPSNDGTTHFSGARCFSACVYALMGGKKRVVPPESEVGIHRMFTYESGIDPAGATSGERRMRFDDGGMTAALERYSGTMGVSPALVAEAEHISPDRVHILSRGEIARWRLAASKL